jgi:hypothetical protein
MNRRTASLLAPIVLLVAGSAGAQVMYGGYNLGPDYGAMIQQEQQKQQVMNAQMQQQAQSIVAQAMQSPECQQMYRRHLAQGGTLSFPQFAYQYVATGRFSAEGIARYRRSEGDNQRREAAAWAGVRAAEEGSAAAMQENSDHYARGQDEAGEVLRGNSSWVDPNDGQRRALSYTGENAAYTDPASGRVYQRDASGQYYVQGADGLWYPMTPAR